MKMSEEIKNMLIEMYESQYEYNRVRLNMDGLKIHYDECDIKRMREQNEEIRKILENLRAE